MRTTSAVEKIKRDFTVPIGRLYEMIAAFHAEMDKGLAGRKSPLKMIPTYVRTASGKEHGRFVALDLGGSNFRVIVLELKGAGQVKVGAVERFSLKEGHVRGSAKDLFGFLAGAIKRSVLKAGLGNTEDFHIGFTFSFPVDQTGIANGKLVRWTKGFGVEGVEGRDVVQLLNRALASAGLKRAKVAALANDTVGTLVAESYERKHADVGLILGTGTNACYLERVSHIRKLTHPVKMKDMIVNIEWGNFDKLPLTRFDRLLDAASSNPYEQVLEKMVSGMYLGEIARLAIRHLIEKGGIFDGLDAPFFDRPYSFKTEYLSGIEADGSKELKAVSGFLRKNGVLRSSYADRFALRKIARAVSSRAAAISAAAVIAVVTKNDPLLLKPHLVAVDGTVFEKYFAFKDRMFAMLRELAGDSAPEVRLAKDGSGVGAAIIAAVALEQE